MIGEKIKELRLENKMTQKALADKLFVTAQAVSRWENGSSFPDITLLPEIASVLNISIDSLGNGNIAFINANIHYNS